MARRNGYWLQLSPLNAFSAQRESVWVRHRCAATETPTQSTSREEETEPMAYKPFDLTGKKVLVTGGNSGIGLGMAEALAQAGADVCIWGTNPEKNAAALKLLDAYGGKAVALLCDVSDEQEVGARFAETVRELGHVDACFANAGVSSDRRRNPQGFVGMTYEEWRRVMSVNLDGAFFT